MISKELLSEVLGIELRSDINIRGNTLIHSHSEYGWGREINIYELAHKCKEWAYNVDDEFLLYSRRDVKGYCYFLDCNDKVKEFYAETEPEAIFKACQYILDKGGK